MLKFVGDPAVNVALKELSSLFREVTLDVDVVVRDESGAGNLARSELVHVVERVGPVGFGCELVGDRFEMLQPRVIFGHPRKDVLAGEEDRLVAFFEPGAIVPLFAHLALYALCRPAARERLRITTDVNRFVEKIIDRVCLEALLRSLDGVEELVRETDARRRGGISSSLFEKMMERLQAVGRSKKQAELKKSARSERAAARKSSRILVELSHQISHQLYVVGIPRVKSMASRFHSVESCSVDVVDRDADGSETASEEGLLYGLREVRQVRQNAEASV